MLVKLNEQKKQMVEKTWLGYFNQTLYEQGVITETERNRMALRIDNRKLTAAPQARLEAAEEQQEHEPEPEQGIQMSM